MMRVAGGSVLVCRNGRSGECFGLFGFAGGLRLKEGVEDEVEDVAGVSETGGAAEGGVYGKFLAVDDAAAAVVFEGGWVVEHMFYIIARNGCCPGICKGVRWLGGFWNGRKVGF